MFRLVYVCVSCLVFVFLFDQMEADLKRFGTLAFAHYYLAYNLVTRNDIIKGKKALKTARRFVFVPAIADVVTMQRIAEALSRF